MNRLTVVLSALALAGTAAECEAMRALKLRTLAMATPFRQLINDQLVHGHAQQGARYRTQYRDPPTADPKYNLARTAYLECEKRPDGIYIPCGGWGSIHSVDLLERYLDTRW